MGLFIKLRPVINSSTLNKNTTNGIKRLLVGFFVKVMNLLYYRTVQISQKNIGGLIRRSVFRERLTCYFTTNLQDLITVAQYTCGGAIC